MQPYPKVGTFSDNSPSVEPAAKVNLEENGFVVFTEFLDAVELEKVEQNLAR